MSVHPISQAIKDAASEVGFDLAGIAGVGEFRELAKFPDWIEQGGRERWITSQAQRGRRPEEGEFEECSALG